MQRIRIALTARPSRRLGLSALAALLLAVSLFPSSASAAGKGSEISQLEVNSYKRNFGVSAQVAERNLEIQQRGAGIVEQLEGTLGKNYAGVWFDNETGEFVVPTLSGGGAVAEALRGAGLSGEFRTSSAQYSWEELETAQDRVEHKLRKFTGDGTVQTSLDPRANAVVIHESSRADSEQRAQIREVASAEGSIARATEAPASHLQLESLSCDQYEKTCSKPLRGGVAIGRKEKGALVAECTAGFKAVNASGDRFIVTAGHCGEPTLIVGPYVEWSSANTNEENKPQGIGWAEGTVYPGGDWEKIKANGSFWDTESWPSMLVEWGGGYEHNITSESASYVGEWVCHSGITSGASCGSVVWTGVTTENKAGQLIYNSTLVEGSSLCAAEGDSGGPVYAGNTALGLVSRGTEGGSCGPGVYLAYVEITEATDSLGVTVGERVGAPPVAATAVGENPVDGFGPHHATAHGSVDPNGITTNYHYDYGTTTGYGSSTSLYGAGSGWNASPASAQLNNLKGSTTYHYRLVAQNSAGTAYGEDHTFTTPSWPPIVTTTAPTGVIHQEATLNGTVNPQGEATSYRFEYGPTTAYGTKAPIPDASAGSGESAVAVAQKLTGLQDGTYHYRISASNGEGTSPGGDQSFVIDNRPLIQGTTASNVKSGSATLKGEIEPQNFASTYHFEIVRDSEFNEDGFSYARKLPVPDGSAGTGFEYHAVSQETGTTLEPDTLYRYRLVASNVKGTRIGEERTLKTPPVTPVSDFTFGDSGEAQLSEPRGLGEDQSGNLWVADTGHSRLEQFSPDGVFVSSFGKHGPNSGEFLTVNDVATMANKVWAVDSDRDMLLGFSSKGQEESARGAAGQFEDPLGITAAPGSFNVWVTDHDKHRLQKYGLSGEAILTVTGGSGNGPALEGPAGAQRDGNTGDIWVADSTAGRVLEYSSAGSYRGSIGENGTKAGQLHHPSGVAILPSGDVVVSDGDPGGANSRIQAFSSSGEYLGTLVGPQGPAFGDVLSAGGYLYASESGEGVARVRRWHFPQVKATSTVAESVRAEKAILTGTVNPWGTKASYHFEYGTSKAYGSQLPIPDRALAAETGAQDAEQEITGLSPGTTYHYRLVAVNSSGAGYGKDMTFKTASAKAPSVTTDPLTAVSLNHATLNGTVNPNGASTTYRFEYVDAAHYALGHFASAQLAPVPNKSIGSGASAVAVSQEVTGLQPHTLYHVRLRATNAEGTVDGENRAFTTPPTFQPPTYSSSFGSRGSGNGQFMEAMGIATDPSGNVWVSDSNLNRIEKFNSKGEYLCKIGSLGSGNGQFSWPLGLASDSSGNVWVADSGNARLQKIGPSCEYLSQLGSKGSGNGQLATGVDGVAIDSSGNIWVADYENSRIQKFNSKGEYLSKCGSYGTGNGQFKGGPLSIAADSEGNVWVGDETPRLQKFSSKCEYLAKFDKASSGAPSFGQPTSIAIDAAGNLWIPQYYSVSGFYPEGEYFGSFGESGGGEGQFAHARAIAIAPDGSLWVTDAHSGTSPIISRVEKWVPPMPYSVETGRAAQVRRTEATLTGTVNPEGIATSYQFEYGTTQTFGSSVPATPKAVGSGSQAVAVSEHIDGLKAETTYYYHVVATTEAGKTYGETRHFTTLAAPKAESQMLIGGKTFSELGIKEATFALSGSFRIEIGNPFLPSFQCSEKGTGTLVSTGLSQEKVTLNCVVIGAESNCYVEPFTFYVNGSFESAGSFAVIHTTKVSGKTCNVDEVLTLPSPKGSFQYGSEATSLNVTASATGSYGNNPVTMSGNSHWALEGPYIGKVLAFDVH